MDVEISLKSVLFCFMLYTDLAPITALLNASCIVELQRLSVRYTCQSNTPKLRTGSQSFMKHQSCATIFMRTVFYWMYTSLFCLYVQRGVNCHVHEE